MKLQYTGFSATLLGVHPRFGAQGSFLVRVCDRGRINLGSDTVATNNNDNTEYRCLGYSFCGCLMSGSVLVFAIILCWWKRVVKNNVITIRGVVLVLRGGSTYHEHALLRSLCLQCVSTIKCEKGARLGFCGQSTLVNVSESQGWCCHVLCWFGVKKYI